MVPDQLIPKHVQSKEPVKPSEIDVIQLFALAATSQNIVEFWVGEQQAVKLHLAVRSSACLREANSPRVLTQLACVLPNLQGQIREGRDRRDCGNEFADTPQVLDRHMRT